MRRAHAHEAVLDLPADADERAPGGAITLELCGGWDHEPPCPLAAHHTSTARAGDQLLVRTVFVADAGTEQVVRERIDQALSRGELRGPDQVLTRWHLQRSGPSTLTTDETALGDRLLAT